MTRRVRWSVVGACAALVLAAGLVAWYVHARRAAAEEAARLEAERLEAEAAAAREALYRQFGIDAPGTRLFVPLPPRLPHHLGRAKLGQKLFNNPRLASSKFFVCGTCHWLGAGGTDSKIHHDVRTRPVYNASFATSYLHDGSLPNLHAAVAHMIEHPHFSAGGALADVAGRLAGDASVAADFRREYGKDGLTGSNVVDAVVEYMKTLVTDGTAFDFWCAGDTDSLTSRQWRGGSVFLAARCMDCHDGPVLGSRKVVRGAPAPSGRQLKVPALRGLGLRKAYLTEGKVNDLDAVVPKMPGGDLSPEDRKALVDFLKTL